MTLPTLSLMVVPNGADVDAMPLILVDHGGVWRDMSSTGHKVSQVISKVNENLEGLAQLIGKQPLPIDYMILSNMFNDFFELIVPPKVRELLTKTLQAAGPNQTPLLRIHTHSSNEWIPWEILRDGTDLLGLRFQVARLPMVPHILEAADNQPRQVRTISNFLGQHVLDDAQRSAWEHTFNGLIKASIVHNLFPQGNSKDYPDFQRISEHYQDADILHVMCHGMKDQRENVYLTLNHRSAPETSILYNITSASLNGFVFRTRPLVFGNGCSSSGAVSGQNQIPGGLMPPGMGAAFFSRGALNFIGTFVPVTKNMALQFARKFYEYLLGQNGVSGSPIAEALWATKRHFQKAGAADPSYLFYCLYGPPETSYRTE
jgi:hypothetical protein